MHLAGSMGLTKDKDFEAAYWKAFEEFFGAQNGPVVKAMLLARSERVDTGSGDLDRVCFGLRQTMSWLAEAIERKALATVGKSVGPGGPPRTGGPGRRPTRRAPSGPKRKKSRSTA